MTDPIAACIALARSQGHPLADLAAAQYALSQADDGALLEVAKAAQRRVIELERAARALMGALPRCQYPDCTAHATYGVVTHEPEWCEEHRRASWTKENGEREQAYGIRCCDYIDELRALVALVGDTQ